MDASRRNFLAAGLSLPAVGLAIPSGSDPLRFRTLGRTGLKVTSVAFGCMITSDASVVEKAADLGINYFDTARGYQGGNNERMVGAALKGRRNRVYISSKTHGGSKEEALKDLDTSLAALGTDHLDIWYLHGRTSAEQVTDELVDAQQTAKKAGKVRFTGVSTHGGQASVIAEAVKRGNIDVVLMGYNFTAEPGIQQAIDQAKEAGLGLVAMKVMAGGFRRARPGSSLYTTLKKDGAMVAALKWVLKNPKIDSTIPSMTDMDQLDENFKAMTATFTDADQQVLSAYLEHIRPLYCRMCNRCDGACPKGLPVADMLRFLTYADGYGQFPLGRERFQELPAHITAVRCRDCQTCAVECRNGVHVAERLARAQELFA